MAGELLTAFKLARVTPLLKQTSLNHAQVDNYRPISLLPFLSKVIERSAYKQVFLSLDQNNPV